MTMLEYLEQDKARFTEALASAAATDKAGKIIESEMDRILLRYNEGCEHAAARDAAACMLQTVRLSAGLVDSVGEVKIWVNPQEEGKKKAGMPFKAKLLAGGSGVSMAAAMVIAFMTTSDSMRATDIVLAVILAVAAPILGLFSGKMSSSQEKAGSSGGSFGRHKDKNVNQNVEKRVDPQRIYSSLHNVLFAVDQNLQNLYGQENSGSANFSAEALAAGPGMVSERELDLFAGLMEAYYSEDGEYALEKLQDVKLYLHRNKIEAVDFDGSNRELFDFMPSVEKRTLRPALVAEGKIVRRGLASGK